MKHTIESKKVILVFLEGNKDSDKYCQNVLKFLPEIIEELE